MRKKRCLEKDIYSQAAFHVVDNLR